ncbi:MAG: hypothetical protein P8Y24_13305 [Gammaproteobacteria bacterium]
MSKKSTVKPLSIALGTAFAASMAASNIASAAQGNPFATNELSSGYMQVAAEGKCGGQKKSAAEGKCGGEKKSEKEGKCGGEKKAEKEGKCGEGKKATKEGKCGEGKCGANKK